MSVIKVDYGEVGGGSQNCSFLYCNYTTNFPAANEYKRDDFDDWATVSGAGTNTITLTFKKKFKGCVSITGLANTLGGTASYSDAPIYEMSTNPPKHNGICCWEFEVTEVGQTLIFACGGGWTQKIDLSAPLL